MNEDFLRSFLQKREQEGTLRSLPIGTGVDFLSNDYLGLSRNAELMQRVEDRWGQTAERQLGGTGSRLLSGNHTLYGVLEAALSRRFKAEAALVFNSGYQANQSLIASVAGKGDVILYDEFSHVCIKEGARLSLARTFSFRHNDLSDLGRRLRDATKEATRVFVVTESLFSMDGDFAPLEEIVALCEELGAYVIVDEAHSTGVYGESGSGLLCELGLQHRVFAVVYTFGKAIGSHGACVAGSQDLKKFLINTGRSFIYTTALPPHSLCTLLEAFDFLEDHPELAMGLRDNIDYFTSRYQALMGVKAVSRSAIQPIAIAGVERCMAVAHSLRERGYDIMAIRSPTVRPGAERLRVCLHNFNTHAEMDGLLAALAHELNA